MTQGFGTFILALWLLAMLVGCGGIAPSGQPAPTPGGMLVTVRVADAYGSQAQPGDSGCFQ